MLVSNLFESRLSIFSTEFRSTSDTKEQEWWMSIRGWNQFIRTRHVGHSSRCGSFKQTKERYTHAYAITYCDMDVLLLLSFENWFFSLAPSIVQVKTSKKGRSPIHHRCRHRHHPLHCQHRGQLHHSLQLNKLILLWIGFSLQIALNSHDMIFENAHRKKHFCERGEDSLWPSTWFVNEWFSFRHLCWR